MSAGATMAMDELFREVILDHSRRPRNHGSLPTPTAHAEGMNPVCGDAIVLDLVVSNGGIDAIAFNGQGCSISQASTSMMTERVRGQSIDGARRVTAMFRAMMMEGADPDPELADLEALQGVARFPARVKCALLGWNVFEEGIRQATTKLQEVKQ